MSDYKFMKCVVGEELQEEIRKAKVDLGLSEEELMKVALIEFCEQDEENRITA